MKHRWKKFAGMADTAVRMMLRVPYLMVLYYSMTIYEDESIPTLCVNGVSVWVNPKFWDQLSREQKLTAIVHEVFHKMLLHMTRRGGRDPWLWNLAGDHLINNRLVAMKFEPLTNMVIDGKKWSWVCDPKYADPKWTTESIYDDLVKEAEAKNPSPKGGSEAQAGEEDAGDSGDAADSDGSGDDAEAEGEGGGAGADVRDGQASDGRVLGKAGNVQGPATSQRRAGSVDAERQLGPLADIRDFGTGPDGSDIPDDQSGGDDNTESISDFEGRVRKELKDAEAQAKMQGNAPGWLERVIGNAFHTKVNWFDTLFEYLKGMSKADYSWARWSKRDFIRTGCIGPDMYQPAMGGILKFIDTSGSIGGDDIALYDKHMMDVLEQVKPKWVAIAYWDTLLHRLDKFERYEYDIDTSMLKPVGGGGTDFSNWQQVLDELEEQPDVVLAYTDMCATFPRAPLSVPTVWLSTTSISTAPFGTVINIE